MRTFLALPILALAAVIVVPPALASGSTSGGGYVSGSDSYPSNPRDLAAEQYGRGKSMVKKRISCKKCSYPLGVQDTPTAKKVAASVRAGEFSLKPAEREQVLYYLTERFGA